jgi:hypothetical protein
MKLILRCALVLLLGCATSRSASARPIYESDARGVENCSFVGSFTGYSNVAGALASTGIQNAKNDVLDQAEARGATHVVWQSVAVGWGSTAAGNAYRCEAASPGPAGSPAVVK